MDRYSQEFPTSRLVILSFCTMTDHKIKQVITIFLPFLSLDSIQSLSHKREKQNANSVIRKDGIFPGNTLALPWIEVLDISSSENDAKVSSYSVMLRDSYTCFLVYMALRSLRLYITDKLPTVICNLQWRNQEFSQG